MTIVELKDLIQDHFETSDIELKHGLNTATVYFDLYSEQGEIEVQRLDVVITGRDQNKGRIGCHVLIEDAADDWRIVDSIETALRDNFPRVYVHLNYKAS